MDKQTERVYLQPAGFHGEEYYSTWASVRVNDADLEYVRADLLAAALARIERLEGAASEALRYLADLNGCNWIKGDGAGEIDMRQRAKAQQAALFAALEEK